MEHFIAAACGLFGLGMAAWAFVDWRHARRSAAWPTVEGEIVKSAVTRYSRRLRWDWHVEYRYRVDGCEHTGWRTYFGCMVPIGVARNIVQRFPVKSTVTVYYDPHRPGRSVLLPGVNRYTRLSFGVAPLCWAMALAFWRAFS
jgi:hypothetical protein